MAIIGISKISVLGSNPSVPADYEKNSISFRCASGLFSG